MSDEQDNNEHNEENLEGQDGAGDQTPEQTPEQKAADAAINAAGADSAAEPEKSNPEDADEGDAEAAMLAMMEGEEVGGDDSSLDERLADLPNADPISPDSINYTEQSAQKADFQQLASAQKSAEPRSIDTLLDVSLPISIELGRTKMPISDILTLGPGSVVELNKLAGEPVEVMVNQKTVAFGEVVVVDENFGVRITQLMSPADRMKSLAQ